MVYQWFPDGWALESLAGGFAFLADKFRGGGQHGRSRGAAIFFGFVARLGQEGSHFAVPRRQPALGFEAGDDGALFGSQDAGRAAGG
jgi:hypothetical protein